MTRKLIPNTHDTIFKAMYRGLDDNNENVELNSEIKEDFLNFYKKYCNPNSKLQSNDIRPFNLLEKKIFADFHNDLAYLANEDRLILLYEHQSVFNANMPNKLFIYYSKLLDKYLREKKIALKGKTKIKLPVPELYVIEVFDSDEEIDTKSNETYSIYVDSMFDGNEFANRELIRFDVTVIHFDTTKIYKQYLDGKNPEDLIHEFSLFYTVSDKEFHTLLLQDSEYVSLIEKRVKLTSLSKTDIQDVKEWKDIEKQKKDIKEQINALRNHYKSIAVEKVIKKFQAERIFTKILERMGETNMVEAMIATSEEEDTEYLLAKTTLDLIAAKKRNEQFENENGQLKNENEQFKNENEQFKSENEQFKNILIKTFGTFDIDKIKKIQTLDSNL